MILYNPLAHNRDIGIRGLQKLGHARWRLRHFPPFLIGARGCLIIRIMKSHKRRVIFEFLDTRLEGCSAFFKSPCGRWHHHFVVLAVFGAIEAETLVALWLVTVTFLLIDVSNVLIGYTMRHTILRRLKCKCRLIPDSGWAKRV